MLDFGRLAGVQVYYDEHLRMIGGEAAAENWPGYAHRCWIIENPRPTGTVLEMAGWEAVACTAAPSDCEDPAVFRLP